MKKFLAAYLITPLLAFVFAGTHAFAQSYPSPTYQNLTVLGTTHEAAVAITGGSISGISPPIPVASGGTGVATSTGTGSVVLGTSPSIATPTVTGSFTATGLVTTADLATQAANTVLANATGSTASPTAFAMPSCSATGNALNWTTSTGFTCQTASGRLIGVQIFTSSGTYTPDAGTNSVIVELVGGGGAGGGTQATGATQFAAGGGGGSGAYAISRLTSGFSGATVTVGAGGAGNSGGAGSSGGQSVFGSITAPGGGGGAAGTATTNSSSTAALGGLAASIATGANIINAGGQQGQLAFATGNIVSGSVGGASVYGGPGSPSFQATPAAATGYGSGGGGVGAAVSQAAFTGGAGKQGVVIVYEYN